MNLLDTVRFYLTNEGKETAEYLKTFPESSLRREILSYLRRHRGGTYYQLRRDLASPSGVFYSAEDVSRGLFEAVDIGLVAYDPDYGDYD